MTVTNGVHIWEQKMSLLDRKIRSLTGQSAPTVIMFLYTLAVPTWDSLDKVNLWFPFLSLLLFSNVSILHCFAVQTSGKFFLHFFKFGYKKHSKVKCKNQSWKVKWTVYINVIFKGKFLQCTPQWEWTVRCVLQPLFQGNLLGSVLLCVM